MEFHIPSIIVMMKKLGNTAIKEPHRTSTRVRVLSKAMKYVDDETRNEFRDKRLRMLEQDNFVEEFEITVMNDEAYGESDV